ncbi:MAG: DsbA family protein [Nitriliruptoraceae bacterium]
MSTPEGPPAVADEHATGDQPSGPSGGGRLRSMLAPGIALVAVIALAVAALGAGSADDPPTGGDVEQDEQPLAIDDEAEPSEAEPGAPQDDQAPEQPPVGAVSEEDRALLDGLARREPDDPRALGDVDAPVVLMEWGDFYCSYCGIHARDTEPELIERYVDTGILRIEWRDLPLQGDEALQAAIAGQAAADQDAFWALHEALYAADLRRGDGVFDRDFLIETVEELGLDVDRFEASLDDPETLARVQEDAALGQGIGITGTPAFIVGGRPMVGAQPLDRFATLIEMAAEEAGVEIP